jgi:hypothetical protein
MKDVVYEFPVPNKVPFVVKEYQLMIPSLVALPLSVTVPDPQRVALEVVNTGTPAYPVPDKFTTTVFPLGVVRVIVPVANPVIPDFMRT